MTVGVYVANGIGENKVSVIFGEGTVAALAGQYNAALTGASVTLTYLIH